MVLGETAGRDDYERAIQIYESLIHQHPGWIWLQTGLIETLHEYSKRLSRSGDPSAAELRFRHALQSAENLVGNPAAAAPCFHKALIEPFNRLASDLLARPSLPQADLALAIRLARQALEWESTKGLDLPECASARTGSLALPIAALVTGRASIRRRDGDDVEWKCGSPRSALPGDLAGAMGRSRQFSGKPERSGWGLALGVRPP